MNEPPASGAQGGLGDVRRAVNVDLFGEAHVSEHDRREMHDDIDPVERSIDRGVADVDERPVDARGETGDAVDADHPADRRVVEQDGDHRPAEEPGRPGHRHGLAHPLPPSSMRVLACYPE